MTAQTPQPQLSAEEEIVLARRIEAGVMAEHLLATGDRPVPATDTELRAVRADGRRTFQQFLLGYVRLAGRLAADEARRSGLGMDELFQEGFIAMAEALQRFDHRIGRFSTYATVRIRQHLAEVGAARLGEMGLPASRALRVRRARGLAGVLDQQYQRSVKPAEVAEALGSTPQLTRRLLGHATPITLDAVAESLIDPSPIDIDQGLWAADVRRLLAKLNTAQAQVLRLRCGMATGEPNSVASVARRLGLSVSSVQRLERAGLAELRELLEPPSAERRLGFSA